MLIELGVLTVAMLIAGNMVLPWLPVLFVIMVLLAIFSTGVAMLLASANVYFNDVTYLWAIAAQLLFYATPVIWDPESVGEPWLTNIASWLPDRRLRDGDPRGDVRPAHAEPGALRPAHGVRRRLAGDRRVGLQPALAEVRGGAVSTATSSNAVHSVEVEHVTKTFRRHHERATSLKQFITGGRRRDFDDFVALDDVSFNVRRGEVFGVIGHNGSGKSTMLKCMASIIRPTRGTVRVHDRMSALLELGAGFHPELTGRENVYLNAALLGMTRREIAERYDEIVEFSGLEDQFLDTPVKTYSSGMYVRLAFAIAINVEPDLLIIDEILAVGDIDFQRKCTERFLEFRNSGRTTVLVTHDLESVRTMCDRAVWLDHGKLLRHRQPGRDRRRVHAVDVGRTRSRRRPRQLPRGQRRDPVHRHHDVGRRRAVGPGPHRRRRRHRPRRSRRVRTWRARRCRSR